MKLALAALAVLGLAALLARGRRRRRAAASARRAEPRAIAEAETRSRLWSSLPTVERETGSFGRWHETRLEGQRVAFQQDEGHLLVFGGDFDSACEQRLELHLGRTPEDPRVRLRSAERLDRWVGRDGAELARRYHLLWRAEGNVPLLGAAPIREALLSLSPQVVEVGFFESGGVFLRLRITRTMRTFDRDLGQLVALVEGQARERSAAPA